MNYIPRITELVTSIQKQAASVKDGEIQSVVLSVADSLKTTIPLIEEQSDELEKKRKLLELITTVSKSLLYGLFLSFDIVN